MSGASTISDDDLRRLVASNPNQGTLAEYRRVLDTIHARAPCNLLVFGVGRDSGYWMRANTGGETDFVEHEPEWIRKTEEQVPDIRIHRVSYGTRRIGWWWRLLRPRKNFLDDLPGTVRARDWDVIFVDGPQGHRWKDPGRMKSIYTAGVLARRSGSTDVLVHDCDRIVERVYTNLFLGSDRLVEQVDTLRHYHLPA